MSHNFESYLSKLLNSPENEFGGSILTDILSDNAKTKEFYISIFIELSNFVIHDELMKIKHLSSLMEHSFLGEKLPVIQECYTNEKNPLKDTNLIIFCCKYNKYTVLEYLFSKESTLLSYMSKVRRILPEDEDGESHNAFYYAIKSKKLHLLTLLFDKGAEKYFSSSPDQLDYILSHTHGQLKLNNVLLNRDIEIFLEKKLLENRFFSNPATLPIGKNPDSKKQRKELIVHLVNLLDTDNDLEVSERFLFILKCIAQNIFVLKHQMKHTYSSLPWEEIEFCVICFIISCTKQEVNLFFSTILNKIRIKNHLSYFLKKLISFERTRKGASLSSKRDEVVAKISEESPEFKNLYEDYRQIRDVYSLEKINYFVNLALSAEPSETEGQLIIIRCLQGIGEHMKNTLESPKMSTTLSDLIISSLPKNTRRIIIGLRNSLSHSDSLSERMEIQNNKNVNFFVGLKEDIKKIGDEVFDVLYNFKINTIRKIIDSIIKCVDISEILDLSKLLQNVVLNKGFENFRKPDVRLRDTIKKLQNSIKNPPTYVTELFASIDAALSEEETKNESTRNKFALGLLSLKQILSIVDDFPTNLKLVSELKLAAGQVIPWIKSEINHDSLRTIRLCFSKIKDYIDSSPTDSYYGDEIFLLIHEIDIKLAFFTNDINYISELKESLVSRHLSTNKDIIRSNNIDKKPNYYFKDKLSELRNAFIKNGLRPELSSVLSPDSLNEELNASLEIIILDIMSVLSIFDDCLSDNFRFLDDVYPLLVGKCLRNHIAHDNAVVDILYSEPTNMICLNALLLLENNWQDLKRKIGKVVPDEPAKVRDTFDERLHLVENKENLFAALAEGNLEQVKSLVQRGADLKARSIHLMTSFHFAAKGGNLEIFKYLLNEGILLNVVDGNGQSPLHIAALHGREEGVEFILKVGSCDINMQDKRGKTPLHLAALRGHRGVVELLLRKNADSDILDSSGFLSLHSAVINNHFEVVKSFHEINGFVDVAESAGGYTTLHIAAERDHLSIVNFLLEIVSNVNAKNDRLATPLHGASLNGCFKVVQALISKRADVNAKVLDGCTPLHYAVENGHEPVVNVLIENGANVNSSDSTYNNTPLHYAAMNGHLGIIKLLLQKKADVNAVTVNGQTPLHFAAKCFDINILLFLLENGAHMETKDNNKMRPLHVASLYNNKDALNILIKEGANINCRCFNNFTPLHFACWWGHSEIVNILVENNVDLYTAPDSDGNSPLHSAAFSGKRDIVETLLKKGAAVNAKNLEGCLPLHIAAMKGHTDAVSLLLNHSANVNSKCQRGLLPLHHAVIGNQSNIVELLLENKAQLNARSDDGATPLQIAAYLGHKGSVDTLIKLGADINTEGDCTPNPLLMAVMFNHEEVVECLLKNGANANGREGSSSTTNAIEKLNLSNSSGEASGFKSFGGNSLLNLFDDKISMESVEKNLPQFLLINESIKTFREKKNDLSLMLGPLEKSTIFPVSAGDSLLKFKTTYQEYELHRPNTVPNSTPRQEKQGFGLSRSGDCKSLVLSGSNCPADCPLIAASYCGFVNIVKLLLKFGGDINRSINGVTALLAASYRGHTLVVKALLERRCLVDPVIPVIRFTPLCFAAFVGSPDIAESLITHGANINWECELGTPLILASGNGHADVVRILLKNNAKVNVRECEGRTGLEFAVARGHLEVVKILVKSKKVNLNAKFNGWTLMLIASQEPRVEMVKFLAEEGCDIHVRNDKGSKPIHLAAREGSADTVAYLVSKGCSVNEGGVDNQTPLHYSVICSRFGVVKYLVENGADVNATESNSGSTPLHFAALLNSSIKIVEYLLQNGAYYNILNKIHLQPKDCSKSADFINLLSATDKLFESIKSQNLQNVKCCIESGAVVNATNSDSKTPLFYAAWKGASDVMELLLKNKARPNVVDDKGFTPLHYASKFSHLNVALQLLKFGAVYNSASLAGKTPSDFTKDKSLTDVFNLISKSFKDVENGSVHVITKLSTIKDLSLLKGIMGATNEANQNLITVAVLSNYPFLEQLKSISQSNVISDKEVPLAYACKGDYKKALGILKKILDEKIEIFGTDNLSTIEIELDIAKVLFKQGSYDEVLRIVEKIVQKQEKMLTPHHEVTLKTKSFIALVLHYLDRNEQALIAFQETYLKQQEVLGEDHSDTSETYFHMALVLDKLGRHQEALKINRRLYEKRRKLLGDLHPYTVVAQNNIALVLSNKNDNAEALRIYQEVFEKKTKIFGVDNPETLRTLSNIAGMLDKLNKVREAAKIFNKLSCLQEKVLGLNHPDTLTTILNYSTSLFHKGKYFSALKELRKCLPGIKCIFGQASEKYQMAYQMLQGIFKILKMVGETEEHILGQMQLDIMSAVKKCDRRAFYNLLVEGADINVKDIDGITPLIFALNSKNVNFIKMLLRYGADVTLSTNKGNTALHTAVSQGDLGIVEVLLKNVKKTNLFDLLDARTLKSGSTALHVACMNGCLDMVKILLRYGANFKIKNKERKAPISVSKNKDVNVFLKLLDELHNLGKKGDAELTGRLKNLKHDEFLSVTNARDDCGKTLLVLALENKHMEIAKQLCNLLKSAANEP